MVTMRYTLLVPWYTQWKKAGLPNIWMLNPVNSEFLICVWLNNSARNWICTVQTFVAQGSTIYVLEVIPYSSLALTMGWATSQVLPTSFLMANFLNRKRFWVFYFLLMKTICNHTHAMTYPLLVLFPFSVSFFFLCVSAPNT